MSRWRWSEAISLLGLEVKVGQRLWQSAAGGGASRRVGFWVVVVGGLASVGGGRCAAGVKTLSWLGAGLAMVAAAAIVDLLGGIADCCCISLAHFDGAAPGETLDPCDRTLAAPWCRFPPWGLRFWSWTSASGTSGWQGVCVEASVATMVVSSDVGDVALVAVVGSSPACSWVCLGLCVAVKSKLRWRVPGGVR
jgi:hypothetical protein